jgi:hypothetical protein
MLARYRGEPLGRVIASPIASISPGRIVLAGVVEPAWSVLASPLDEIPCVYYKCRSMVSHGRRVEFLFGETNALPFVLNDGTGRVLVAARLGTWTTAKDAIYDAVRADENAARRAGASPDQIDGLLRRPISPAPQPLERGRDPKASDDEIRRHARESQIVVGERVTVIGQAMRRETLRPKDAATLPDDGSALGVTTRLVVGPVPYTFNGLSVLAGTTGQVFRRGRVQLGLASAGALMTVAAFVYLLLVVPGLPSQ